MSTLVDHYLLHLKSLLPARQREDIAAELRGSILSAVEERERDLGRALTDVELNEVLRGFGHPVAVAGRYLPIQCRHPRHARSAAIGDPSPKCRSNLPPTGRQPRSCWILAMASGSFGRAVTWHGRSASKASQLPRPGNSS